MWATPNRTPLEDWIRLFVGQGWVGVDLFFVLSGFLITGILVDTRDAQNYFSGFYARRVLRIFPLYYAVLAGVLVAASMLHPYPTQMPVAADRKLYFVFLTNWLCLWKGHWGPNVLGHFWSLAVEEQFYLLWPVCVWLTPPKILKKLAIGLAALALVIRVVWAMHGGLGQGMVMMTFGRMDSLLLGGVGAMVLRDRATMARVRGWLLPTALVMLGGYFSAIAMLHGQGEESQMRFVQTAGFSMLALGFAAVVLLTADNECKKSRMQAVLHHPVLVRLGAYSYGFYVFHVPVIGAAKLVLLPRVGNALENNGWLTLLLMAVLGLLTFAISAVSYEFFEKPILSLKRYFEARIAGAETL